MSEIPSPPGAAGAPAAEPITPAQVAERGRPTFRQKAAPATGAPVAEPAAPVSTSVETLAELKIEFADLIEKDVAENEEKLGHLQEKIDRLKSGGKEAAAAPAAEADAPAAETLADLKAKLDALRGKAGGKKERERLKAEIRKVKLKEQEAPVVPATEADASAGETQDKILVNRLIQRIRDLGKPETSPAEEAAETEVYDSTREPSPYTTRPEEITAGNLDGGVIDRFSHNATLVLGGDGVTGLIRGKLDELAAQQERYQRGKAKIAGMKEEHGRRLFGLAESKAVADARAEVNAANTAQNSESTVRNKFLEANAFNEIIETTVKTTDEKGQQVEKVVQQTVYEQFKKLYDIESAIAQADSLAAGRGTPLNPKEENELFLRLKDTAQAAGIDKVTTLQSLKSNLEIATGTGHNAVMYQWFKKVETGGNITVGKKEKRTLKFQGRQVLEARNDEARRNLNDAQNREEVVRRAQEGIRKTLPAREKALVESGERLTRIGQFVHERFVPDREELLATITELGAAREALGDLSRMQELGKKHGETITRKTALRLAKLPGEIDDLVDDISEMTDPRERLAECTDLERGLQLADQENLDFSRLSRDDQFQLVLAQTLLGIPAEPTPPPVGEPPEKPPAAPAPAETRFSQMTGVELNALDIEGLRAISAELTPDQVASLSSDLRSSLEREGLLTANQYGRLPVFEDIANVADQLERVPDNQVAGQLKKMVEAARQEGEKALGDVNLLLEELYARVAGVVVQDNPDRANQQMKIEGAKAALEKNLTSPNKTVAARAKSALKLLGAAGLMALMVSNTGGEQH